VTEYGLIFGFSLLTFGETLIYLFHCILQVEIKTIQFKILVMVLPTMGNQVLIISTMFHWTCDNYDWIFGFIISVL